MKTKDHISKKKQELRKEINNWKSRQAEIMSRFAFLLEERETKAQEADFCRQEIAKREKEIDSLQIRTRAQIRAGWR